MDIGTVTLDDRETLQALDLAAQALRDTGPLMKTIANLQFRSTIRNFDEQQFDGVQWPALKASTAMALRHTIGGAVSSYSTTPRAVGPKGAKIKRLPTGAEVEKYETALRRAAQRTRTRNTLPASAGLRKMGYKHTGMGARRGFGNILHPTGTLIRDRISASNTQDEARVTCAQWWAFVHNFGAPAGKSHFMMPRRTFMGIQPRDLENIQAACTYYVSEAFKHGPHGGS